MRGFIIAIVIIVLVIGTVFIGSGVLHAKIIEIEDEVNDGDYGEAIEDFEELLPFLCLFAPDGLLREVELSFCEIKEGGEVEKSRLLVLLEDLRRQVGLCPIAVF